MDSLENKVVLVTGSARRVGAATVRLLHEGGARIIVHYRGSRDEADRLAGELNGRRAASAVALGADLLRIEEFEAFIAAAADAFGRLDVLVNNASSFFATPFGKIGPSDWDDLIGSNLRAPLFLAQAAAVHLRRCNGCIVNITDIHVDRPLRDHLVYTVAKAGLAGLTRALAVELGPQVRVNAVAPGAILWPDDHDGFSSDERERIVRQTLLAREGAPEDIARTIRFLIADAPYITGQTIAVDGGRSVFL